MKVKPKNEVYDISYFIIPWKKWKAKGPVRGRLVKRYLERMAIKYHDR